MNNVLGYRLSTQPAVMVDTLEDSQVQDTQTDDQLQQTDKATPNLDTSDTAVPSPASTDLTVVVK